MGKVEDLNTNGGLDLNTQEVWESTEAQLSQSRTVTVKKVFECFYVKKFYVNQWCYIHDFMSTSEEKKCVFFV